MSCCLKNVIPAITVVTRLYSLESDRCVEKKINIRQHHTESALARQSVSYPASSGFHEEGRTILAIKKKF